MVMIMVLLRLKKNARFIKIFFSKHISNRRAQTIKLICYFYI